MSCNVVVVGERGVGKTALVNRFIDDSFTKDSCMSKTKKHSNLVSVGCQKVLFNVFDTQGDGEDEEFAAACRVADSVLLCYKASDLQSLQSAAGKWFNLVRKFNPNSPVVQPEPLGC